MSMTSKHRGPDMDFQDHRVNKLIIPKSKKRKNPSSNEIKEAVDLFLKRGGIIKDLNYYDE